MRRTPCSSLRAAFWADLELYLARGWVALAASSSDGDARKTFTLYLSSERVLADSWQAKDCTGTAIEKAKAVSALVRKALDKSGR